MNKETVSSEEEQLIDLFVILVEKFESEHYPSQNRSQSVPVGESTPHSRLLHLMDANDLQPADLASIFGSSDRVFEVINGTQAIDRTQAEKLSDRFNLPSKLFLA